MALGLGVLWRGEELQGGVHHSHPIPTTETHRDEGTARLASHAALQIGLRSQWVPSRRGGAEHTAAGGGREAERRGGGGRTPGGGTGRRPALNHCNKLVPARPGSVIAARDAVGATQPGELEPGGSEGRTEGRDEGRNEGGRMKMQAEVIREGELEKRSDSLFQLWKKKLVVLTKDSLSLFPDGHKRAKGKELGFGSILKVDCVERTGKYIYFTIVTKDRKEIDFRCPDQSCWNASITMALIDFQNKRAIQDFKSRQEMEQAAGTQERRLARAP